MPDAIFLSAGIPDPKRGPTYARTADTIAIAAAVSAVVHVTLGRRRLVWGGHPAITPMIWVVATDLGLEYAEWVTLYQSRYFADDFPEDNERFQNIVHVDAVAGDRAKSLDAMRSRMFTESRFEAAVFIGGMEGIVDEFRLFRRLQPHATVVPIPSTGGAALTLVDELSGLSGDLSNDMDYVGLLHRHLAISVREMRYRRPAEQPADLAARLWQRPRRA